MSAEDRTCSSCGAHLSPEADRCDLCGTPVEEGAEGADEPPDPPSGPSPSSGEDEASSPVPDGEPEGAPSVFCNHCGWENPPGARYCSRCGEELQDLSEAAPAGTRRVKADLPSGDEPRRAEASAPSDAPTDASSAEAEADRQAAMGRQIAVVVGGGLALVLTLFFVTQWSSQYEWGASPSQDSPAQAESGSGASSPARSSGEPRPANPAATPSRGSAPADLQALLDQTADSLTGPVADQIDSLRTRIDRASEAEKRQLRAKLVNLLIGAGHPGRAAVVQKDLAEATGSVDAQRRAADLLYRWMQKLQNQGQRKQVFQVARHAAQAYKKVADRRPDDLDARTRMGEAYLLTNEPMKGIQAINAVIKEDSTFVPARFQKGLALLQINRLDQAVKQFKKVKRYAKDGSPFYQQAERALKVIKQQRSGASSGTSGSAAGADA